MVAILVYQFIAIIFNLWGDLMFKHRLLIMTVALLVIAPAVAVAGDGGLYFGIGMGGRMINGTGDYTKEGTIISEDLEETISYSADIDGVDILGWNRDGMARWEVLAGYRFSPRFGACVVFSSYLAKDRDYTYANTGRADTQQIINGEIKGGTSALPSSSYDQTTLRLAGQYYFTPIFFLNAGIEYIAIKTSGSDADTYGVVVGLGMEKELSNKFALVTTAGYSFARYKGDDLGYTDLNLNIGGLDLGMELRYYVK